MYKIADINMELKGLSESFKASFKDYQCDGEEAELSFSCDEKEIISEDDGKGTFSRDYLQFIAFHRKIAEQLPFFNSFVFHCACFEVNGQGIVFAAHSGVGKTTHMTRWKSYLGDKMTIINGDKPIVRFYDNKPFAYGTPWNGKEGLGCNKKTPLKHICFIERDSENYAEAVDKALVIDRIFNQIYMPKNPQAAIKTMELMNILLNSCNIWMIHCNTDENAGERIYKQIFKK